MAGEPPAWEFPATGTRWRIYHSGRVSEQDAAKLADAVRRDEARWSRFLPDSEISELNRTTGGWRPVTTETFALLGACADWTRRTGGVFQPLVGRALRAWGYADSLDERVPFATGSPAAVAIAEELELDHARRRVRLPEHARLDLGGIGKGWIAQRLSATARGLCDDPRLLIDAGGDLLAVSGDHTVAVDELAADADGSRVWIRLRAGYAVATSGYGQRRWTNGDGRTAHHLIDPYTGAPGPHAQATVVAPDAVAADVLAKTLALRPATIAGWDGPARVQTVGGAPVTSDAWREIPPRGLRTVSGP